MKQNYFRHIFMFLCLLTGISVNAYDALIDGVYYNFHDDEAEVTYMQKQGYDYYSGYNGSVVIPSSVNYNGKSYKVTSIGDHAFAYNAFAYYYLDSITIPNSIKSIGNSAFYKCSFLKSITIPEGVTSIDSYAFFECSGLTSVVLPNSITSIGSYAFSYCSSLASINIPEGLTNIEHRTFDCCTMLASIDIPSNVVNIDSYAFSGCTSLAFVNISNEVKSIGMAAFENCSSLTSITLPDSLTSIENSTFSGCISLPSINIPDGVKSIGIDAFEGCAGMSSFTIPSSVSNMGYSVFQGCYFAKGAFVNNSNLNSSNNWGATIVAEETSDGLLISEGYSGSTVVRCRPNATSVNIPNGVKVIGKDAFASCENLSSITIPPSLTSSECKFDECGKLSAVYISDLSAWCKIYFSGTQHTPLGVAHHLYLNGQEIKDLVIPSDVTSVKNYAFYLCYGLNSITIPSSVKSIGKHAFQGCTDVTSVTFQGAVSSIDKNAFQYCGQLADSTSVHISDLAAWCNCSFNTSASNPLYLARHLIINGREVKDLVIPNGVSDIKEYAFYNCSSLNSLTISSGVNNIGTSAFKGCIGLNSIKVEQGNTKYDSREGCNAIIETATNTLIMGSNNTFIPNSVSVIGDKAFENSCDLRYIAIPEGVTSMGSSAFLGCCFSKNAFVNNSSLTSTNYWGANIFDGEETDDGLFIQNYVVVGCRKSAISVAIPDKVTGFAQNVFQDCRKLTSITIPASITNIPDLGLYYCKTLSAVHISDLEAWCKIAFANPLLYFARHLYLNGEEVKELVIPNSVSAIANYCFAGCDGITSVSIPDCVTQIGNYAFGECLNLTDVWCYAENVPESVNNPFDTSPISSATLHVPAGSIDAYRTSPPWSKFGSIVPIMDEDNIKEIRSADNADNILTSTERYDLSGRRMGKNIRKGIYIVNGKKIAVM